MKPVKANAIAVLVMGGHVAAQAVSANGHDTYTNVLLGQLEAIAELLKPTVGTQDAEDRAKAKA